MSKNQLEKIEEFISSIENEEIGEKTQSFVNRDCRKKNKTL